jgi:RNA polymerase sigma factor (sigma-70 family)
LVVTRELERTYRQHGPRLLGWIRSRVADAAEAEDILQEVFASALRSYSVTEPIENLLAWLARAARNRVIDWYRRKRRQPMLRDAAALDELPAAGDGAGDEAERAARLAELAAAIGELPDAQRQVIVEQALAGRTFREIAEQTGVPLGTLLARKHAAVRTLRRRLEQTP